MSGNMNDGPWLRIPADDYAAHMRAVGQDGVLREAFARAVAETRPTRVAVLGCTTGEDLAQLDPRRTTVAVGVDINPEYLRLAGARLQGWGDRLRFICADVCDAELPPGPYDLVHAALLLEYVPPAVLLRRVHGWLGPSGILSVVIQEPVPGQAAVSDTGFDSLRALAPHMTLRTAAETAELAKAAGFVVAAKTTAALPSGKQLTSLLFDKARPGLGRQRGRARC
jgi:SAM-dependent methyltransferase